MIHRPRLSLSRHAPGLLLVGAISVLASLVAGLERRLFGHAVIDVLVVAILLGAVLRTLWTPPGALEPGVRFASREVLEAAVLLLGASIDLPLLLAAGPVLAIGIVATVVLALAGGEMLGRLMRLPRSLATLIACGNAICGNSAIAAVAPIIGAEEEHVTAAIAFTAAVGVIVVVALPLLVPLLGLDAYEYGVLAGLGVYAVPQVLAATFPVSTLSGQVGTLVKLVRVLMLGPVVLFFAVRERKRARRRSPDAQVAADRPTLVPWFIAGFLVLAAARSADLLPGSVVALSRAIAGVLMLLAMAALGLGTDLLALRKVGGRVITAAGASLLLLLALAYALVLLLRVG